jgi:hypothetical protein
MNKHTATLPNGTKVTRNSKSRTYTHVIAAGTKWGALVNYREASLKFTQHRLAENTEILAGNKPMSRYDSVAKLERQNSTYRETIATLTAELVDLRTKPADEIGHWGAIGWAGSLELANKVAATARNRGEWAEIRVIPAD